jgi:hypothetical protein
MDTDCADGAAASRDCRVFVTATHGRVRQVRARQRASIRRSAQEPISLSDSTRVTRIAPCLARPCGRSGFKHLETNNLRDSRRQNSYSVAHNAGKNSVVVFFLHNLSACAGLRMMPLGGTLLCAGRGTVRTHGRCGMIRCSGRSYGCCGGCGGT